jgi:mannose-6-phosphate isomerase-like protein (cupin superfamily)
MPVTFPSGATFRNPNTGEWARLLVAARPGSDDPVVAELIVMPGGGVPFAHVHPTQDEHFEVVGGRLAVVLAGERVVAGPGERAHVPAGVVHSWTAEGDVPLHARVTLSPGERLVASIAAAWGLCALGRSRPSGAPSFRDGVLMAAAYRDEMALPSPPAWAQRLLVAAVGPFARRGGRSVTSEEVLTAAMVPEEDWPGVTAAAAGRAVPA